MEMEYLFMVPDFFKFLTCEDCSSNELLIPRKICDMQRPILNEDCILYLRNGYKIHVSYDRENRKLVGVGDLFADFGLGGGEVLLFESDGNGKLKVYILGEDGNEIQYPSNLHASQSSSSMAVERFDGGWKFAKFLSFADPIVDEIVPPVSFMRKFGSTIPEWVRYVLKNDGMFLGHYEFLERKLSGLSKVSQRLSLQNFDRLECLVFTYDGGNVFRLSLFDGRSVEIDLNSNHIISGSLFLTFRYPCHFTISIMPYHMLNYCHGVVVPVAFKSLTNMWKKKDKIHVYKGGVSWEFDIKKSRNGNRTTIHGGWIQFRNYLQLNVGDRCFFRWIDESHRHFRVEVVKGAVDNA